MNLGVWNDIRLLFSEMGTLLPTLMQMEDYDETTIERLGNCQSLDNEYE